MPITTERGKIAHLLRRAGFGPSAAELDAAVARGRAAVLDELLNPERIVDPAETLFPSSDVDYARPQTIPIWWLFRMTATQRPLQEKLTLFWHGHLTSALSRVGQLRFTMVNQNELYRQLALGSFRELMLAAAKDPAMIQWLDNNTNRKGKPNENFARELFELFTLGRDRGYTEEDIREAARAFTGWFQRDGVFVFNAGQHDNDRKTVFGKTGNWDGTHVVDMAVEHASTGPYLARTLWEFFVYRNPSDAVVNEIAAVYYQTGYDMRAVLRAIFTHPEFYAERAYHALVKSPAEIMAGLLRGLEAQIDNALEPPQLVQRANQINGAMQGMGQVLFNPPDVNGWPGGEDWVSTTGLITRYNFAALAARDGYTGIKTDVAGLLARRNLTTAPEIVDYFTDLMLDGDLTPGQRQVLLDYLLKQDNGTRGTFTLNEATINKKVRGLVYLIATMPQYQLA